MGDLDYELMENYSKIVASLKCERKDEIMKLFEESKHTSVGKRIICFYAILIVLICVMIVGVGAIGAAAAGLDITGIVFEKTQNTNITDEERQDLADTLVSGYGGDISDNTLADLEALPELQTNENGNTYGDIRLQADLVAVGGTDINGESVSGYYYQDDYNEISSLTWVTCPEEAVQYMEDRDNGLIRNWVYIYDEDGVTILGKWAGSLYTNDMLETGLYDSEIYDGTDADVYEQKVQDRAAELTAND